MEKVSTSDRTEKNGEIGGLSCLMRELSEHRYMPDHDDFDDGISFICRKYGKSSAERTGTVISDEPTPRTATSLLK